MTAENIEGSLDKGVEREPVRMTKEDFDTVRNTFGADRETVAYQTLLRDLKIEVNVGVIAIMVDGESMKMTTREDDFGTVVEDADATLA